jgi:hypothetical protein
VYISKTAKTTSKVSNEGIPTVHKVFIVLDQPVKFAENTNDIAIGYPTPIMAIAKISSKISPTLDAALLLLTKAVSPNMATIREIAAFAFCTSIGFSALIAADFSFKAA